MDITFNCGWCGQQIVVDEAGAGLATDCPKCGQPVTVPSAEQLPKPVKSAPVRVVASPSDMKQCPFCAETIKLKAIVCKCCGRDLVAKRLTAAVTEKVQGPLRRTLPAYERVKVLASFSPKTKYSALRAVATTLKILACLGAATGTLLAVLIASGSGINPEVETALRVLLGFGAIFGGAAWFVLYWAIAEIIMLFIDIEENSRTANAILTATYWRIVHTTEEIESAENDDSLAQSSAQAAPIATNFAEMLPDDGERWRCSQCGEQVKPAFTRCPACKATFRARE